MDGITVQSVDVTMAAALHIMETAVSAGRTQGIGYWADGEQQHAHMKGDRLIVFDWVKDFHGKTEGVVSYQGRGRITLTCSDICDAVTRMLAFPTESQSRGWATQLLQEDYCDGPLADAIVQVATFGKIIYG